MECCGDVMAGGSVGTKSLIEDTRMKVREILTPLWKADLARLCRCRELSVTGTVPELLERLARSYRGEFEAVMEDLRREDLVMIGGALGGRLDLPAGWRQLRASEMRRVFIAVADRSGMPLDGGVSDEYFALYSASGFSTGGGVRRLDIDALRKDAREAERTTVISAYFAPAALNKLLGACSGMIRVVLNGLGGRRLKAQVQELKRLQIAFGAHSRSTEIRLGFADGIFHTKLYLFEKRGQAVAWLGSANATAAGLLGHNEEVLGRLSPVPSAVLDYAEWAWCGASRLDAAVRPLTHSRPSIGLGCSTTSRMRCCRRH